MIRKTMGLLTAVTALSLAALGVAPAALACMTFPTPEKIAAIDAALSKTKLKPEQVAAAKTLRDQAQGDFTARRYADAEKAADRAIKLLKIKWKPKPRTGPPTRC